jgi:hypothetical protein
VNVLVCECVESYCRIRLKALKRGICVLPRAAFLSTRPRASLLATGMGLKIYAIMLLAHSWQQEKRSIFFCMLTSPKKLPLAVTLAIYGFHFRQVIKTLG